MLRYSRQIAVCGLTAAAASLALFACSVSTLGSGPIPDAGQDAAADAEHDVRPEVSTEAQAEAQAEAAGPECTAINCGGACCGNKCIPRNCSMACDAGGLFCPYDPGFAFSNGFCVASCSDCMGAANEDGGACH
jgi:hypothetical protein